MTTIKRFFFCWLHVGRMIYVSCYRYEYQSRSRSLFWAVYITLIFPVVFPMVVLKDGVTLDRCEADIRFYLDL